MAMKKRSAPAKKKKTPSGRKGAKAAPGGRPARKRAGPSGPKGVTARKRPARKAPARRGSAAPVVPEENPRALALARRVGTLVAEKKALDVVILDVRGKTSYADYFVAGSAPEPGCESPDSFDDPRLLGRPVGWPARRPDRLVLNASALSAAVDTRHCMPGFLR